MVISYDGHYTSIDGYITSIFFPIFQKEFNDPFQRFDMHLSIGSLDHLTLQECIAAGDDPLY